jgi:hypothetical protein
MELEAELATATAAQCAVHHRCSMKLMPRKKRKNHVAPLSFFSFFFLFIE